MGNSKSTLHGGGKKVEYEDIQKKLQDIVNSVLSSHMSEITQKTYCKKLKVYMTNDILMNYSKDTLQSVSKNIFIGMEKDDDSADSAKETICKRLTNVYIRKLNLVSSIHIMLDICYKRIYAMKKGDRCISSTPYELSKVELDEFNDDKHKLDSLSGTAIGISNNEFRGSWIDSYKKRHSEVDAESAKKFVFISELFKESDCVREKGTWVTNSRPDPEVKDYNKKWKILMREMENTFNLTSLELISICDMLVEEKIETDDDGISIKKYIDKEVDEKLLNELIKRTKSKLMILYKYVQDRYMTMSNLKLVTKEDVEKVKEIEEAYKKTKAQLLS